MRQFKDLLLEFKKGKVFPDGGENSVYTGEKLKREVCEGDKQFKYCTILFFLA